MDEAGTVIDVQAQKRHQRTPLSATIYEALRAEILRCHLRPGAEISEAELADRFNVSKTPVREALAGLRQDGLVLVFPRRGYQVAPVTIGDMIELFDLRIILEAGAAELACTRITEDETERLLELAKADYDMREDQSLEQFIGANREFHLAIARTTGNGRILRLIERQISELERFFYIGAQARDINSETANEHAEIVEALAARDAPRARALMIRHNMSTRNGLVQFLSTSRRFGSVEI